MNEVRVEQSRRDAEAGAGGGRPEVDLEVPHAISRFVIVRPLVGGWVAESLLNGFVLDLSTPTGWTLFFSFMRPTRPAALLASVDGEKRAAVLRFIEHCHRNELLVRIGDTGAPEEEPGLVVWESHNLFFHTRSRRGRHDNPVGATWFLEDAVPPVPTVKPKTPGRRIPLARSEEAPDDDISLTEALETRRSLYGTKPVPLDILGGFLYRTCRITNPADVTATEGLAKKVYPSGGSLHSLEVYVAARRCKGLRPGLYHYRPLDHELSDVAPYGPDVESLLLDAQRATGGKLAALPSVLFVFTTRFARVARKYQSLSYSAILKEVGGVFQTMYLVASAMGLPCCAIGAGDSDCFSRASGADPWEEPSVGELVLGGPE